MGVESSFLSVLPNLSVGVISVLALVYVTNLFVKHLKEIHSEHTAELKERELALREVEREVRTSITEQLKDNSLIMERVVQHLNDIRK